LRRRLDNWLNENGARLPTPDPLYDAQKEARHLQYIRNQLMPELEAEHARYLDPGWQPNPDWWGSMQTID
jgi:hypothetical protein